MNAAGTIRLGDDGYVGGVDQCAVISAIASSRECAATAGSLMRSVWIS